MNKDYTADNIQALSAGEAIRMRPHLYFEKCFREKTLDSLPFEVLCHAFDEYFDGACKKITIAVRNDSFTVQYDAGIRLDTETDGLSKAEIIMTQIFACKNEKKHLAVGEKFCSLGMATINFAAERCELTTVCNGKRGLYIFEHGTTVSRMIDTAPPGNEFTEIFIKPDKLLFANLNFTFDGINEKAKQVSSELTSLEMVVHNEINAN